MSSGVVHLPFGPAMKRLVGVLFSVPLVLGPLLVVAPQPAGYGWWFFAASLSLAVTVLLAGVMLQLRRNRALRQAMPTVSCAELANFPAQPMACEVKGTAQPGPKGILKAPFTGRPCVWYQVKASERRPAKNRDRGYDYRTIYQKKSRRPFLVRDDSGTALIVPDVREGAEQEIDAPVQVLNDFIPADKVRSQEIPVWYGMNLRNRLSRGSGPQGFRFQEWILPVDQPVYVLGLAVGGTDVPTIRIPDDGRSIVSTLTEGDLHRRSMVGFGIASAMTVGLAIATVVTALIGLTRL
jgi:hypothetical protein